MPGHLSVLVARLVAITISFVGLLAPALAQDGSWRVAKVSGEAWVSVGGVLQASVSQQSDLRAGNSVRTGRSGRVLLVRGSESILISPNSAISLPETGRPGMSSVIQQAGSILLEVDKRNVEHFEVETPYLAAVVKGTRFRVSLEGGRARVDVLRGQVQVADFRSGQIALVLPGQSARASFGQTTGLRLSGQGVLGPIEEGAPRAPGVAPITVPGGGLAAPAGAVLLQRDGVRRVAPVQNVARPATPNEASSTRSPVAGGIEQTARGTLRISEPLGDVKLDVHKVTGGMARNDARANNSSGVRRATVWSTGELNPGSVNGKANAGNSGNAGGAANAQIGAGGGAIGATSSGLATGRSNGNNANANASFANSRANIGANGNSANGNPRSGNNGRGNGNNGNGNGNSGNGNNGNGNGNNGNGNSGR